jgi:hypothetical protein
MNAIEKTLLTALNKACWTKRKELRQAIIDHLIDSDVQAFCEMSRTDMADKYADKIQNGCVGYWKMTDEQLAKEVEDSDDFPDVQSVKEYFELD